jgi:hypothetical protein
MDASQEDAGSLISSSQSSSWNSFQEELLKGISERSNCMRWLHNQCQLHFESLNFWLTIPNVIISTLNGSFTMSLNALFPDPGSQTAATTIIGLISIFSAVLITMNQYVKSQQMMEAHRAAALAQGKLHRIIMSELALRRDQRQNALEFLKLVRTEQDRLENSSPSILPSIIKRFNSQFADRDIEKPEIAGDLDETTVNNSTRRRRGGESNYYQDSPRPENKSPTQMLFPNMVQNALKAKMKPLLAATSSFTKKRVFPETLPHQPERPVRTDESVPENIIIGGGESRPITPPRG